MRIFVVDGNNVAWTAAYTVGHLSYGDTPTGVIYGFFDQVLKLGAVIKPSLIAFAWDSKISLRREIFPEYKQKRRELTPDERAMKEMIMKQVNKLQHTILPTIGFKNIFHFEGYEADDIIASIVHHYKHREIHILSSDNDLYQLLLTDNIFIYSPRNTDYAVTRQNFVNAYGIEPEKWADVKMIGGCTSDEVPGIPRIGEKTALKYLRGELNPSTKTYQKIVSEEGKKVVEFNKQLVKLPLNLLDVTLRRDKISLMQYRAICRKLGFKSLLSPKKLQQARQAFRLSV